ncbi:MAG: VanZ family protein [Candidatus Cloacimonetes bacterium]|nr:VanZ family protein [Candidatus Cloacimonadota bacterium]
MVKKLFWFWLIVLIVVNLIPLGNGANQSLSRNKVFVFRLDYLAHLNMILCFAWIWVLGKIKHVKWFVKYVVLKYSMVVLCASVCLELLQLLVPWRSFNPVDMGYNLLGGCLVVGVILVSRRLVQIKSADLHY